MLKYAIPALALIFVGACGDDKPNDTQDTHDHGDDDDDDDDVQPPEDTLIDDIWMPGCDGGQWVYEAETAGWTNGDNLVNSYDHAGGAPGSRWNEENILHSYEADEDGFWDRLVTTLTPGAAFGDYDATANTLYTCDTHGVPGTMVYAIRVYDADGNYSDCAVFSNGREEGVADILANPSFDGANPVSRPSEITGANCTNWDD